MKNKFQWSGWVCLHESGKIFARDCIYVMGLFDNGLLSFYKWSIPKGPHPQLPQYICMHDTKNIASCSSWRMFLTYSITWCPVEVMITFSKGE